MISDTLTILNKLGLHARAASKLVAITSRFQSKIRLKKEGRDHSVNAKSIMALMMLEATQGTDLFLEIEGPDEYHAHQAIYALVESAFGEAS